MNIDNTAPPDLKPCPFCGGKPGFTQLGDDNGDDNAYNFVICNDCGATCTNTDTRPESDCVAAWNTRAPAPDAKPVASPHIRIMANAVLRQLDEAFPREELDLNAVGLLCRVIVGAYVEGAPVAQQAAEPLTALVAKWRHAAEHLGLDGLASLADCADELESALAAAHPQQPAATALERYAKHMEGSDEPCPIERLRFFLAQALTGQDWLDVEPFLSALQPAATVREPLSADQVFASHEIMDVNGSILGLGMPTLLKVVRAIEAAHGITAAKGEA